MTDFTRIFYFNNLTSLELIIGSVSESKAIRGRYILESSNITTQDGLRELEIKTLECKKL